jgi:acyl-CoA hydrolase
MNMEQRAKALIKIAHPEHQETLEKEACKRFE